jgi:thioredoxin 1
MRTYLLTILTAGIIFSNACSSGQTKKNPTTVSSLLSATEFAEKLKQLPTAPIIDVRTPGEFSTGHLANALNINWNAGNFESSIAELDKTKTVFVYCYSGSRSNAAVSKMKSMGFKDVYELSGGMIKWRAAGLPETTSNTNLSKGMTKQQYEQLLISDKLILIDFYAEWCAPCKKMKPFLEEISNEMVDKVKVVQIDADSNKELFKELNITAIPTLQIYKNNKQSWSKTGYTSKEEIMKQLKLSSLRK